MTYEEALAFWYGRINYEVRAAQPDDLKLDRIRGLLAHLGDPHLRVRAVHVAGSKGKGSTAAMLAAILRQAGYRTGLFTSPHLSRVEERIQVDDAVITRGELTSLMAEIRDAANKAREGEAATFFEVVTAPGFLHFVRRRVGWPCRSRSRPVRSPIVTPCRSSPAWASISRGWEHARPDRREGRHPETGVWRGAEYERARTIIEAAPARGRRCGWIAIFLGARAHVTSPVQRLADRRARLAGSETAWSAKIGANARQGRGGCRYGTEPVSRTAAAGLV